MNCVSPLGAKIDKKSNWPWPIVAMAVTLFLVIVVLVGLIIGFSIEISNLKSARSADSEQLTEEPTEEEPTSISDAFVALQESIDLLNRSLNRQQFAGNDNSSQQLDSFNQQFLQLSSSNQQLRQAIDALNSSLQERTEQITNTLQDALLGLSNLFPASSCAALPSSSPSDYYWIQNSNGSAVSVFCDMDFTCKGIVGTHARNIFLSHNIAFTYKG